MKRNSWIVIVLLLFINIGHTQSKDKVFGKVYSFKNSPLEGVSVMFKKTKREIFTDSLGLFNIEFTKKDVLIFKADGFDTYSLKVKKSTEPINVKMIYINNGVAYDNVINGGYMTKNQLDYSIENEISENNNYSNMNSIYAIIQYINPTAKVFVENGTTQIIMNSRGDNSVMASNNALFVVDGIVVQDISDIAPNQVSSVLVLTAIDAGHWGVRGSGGVIEITLKHGTL